jgi:Niemann-Pick C1 protein
MWEDVARSLIISVVAVFLSTFIFLGFDLHGASMAMITIIMIVVDMFGVMWMWGIQLNAVSLVNLVMVILSVIPSKYICQSSRKLSKSSTANKGASCR